MGLLARVQELQASSNSQAPVKAQGLLERSRRILAQTAASPPPVDSVVTQTDFSPEKTLPRILSEIGSIERGIDAPYLSFEILRKVFGNLEGVFFLPDHNEKVLIPSSAFPLNPDFFARVRIPEEQISSVKSVQLLQDQNAIAAWQAYLPPTIILNKLLIIPCGPGATEGLLMIHNCPVLELDDKSILLISSTLSNALQNMIRESRFTLLQNMSSDFTQGIEGFIQQVQKKSESGSSLLLAFPTSQLRDKLTHLAPSALTQSLERDCLRILGSIVQDDGAVFVHQEYFHIFFSDIGDLDTTLISEQLQFSFQQAFSFPLPQLVFSETDPTALLKSIQKAS